MTNWLRVGVGRSTKIFGVCRWVDPIWANISLSSYNINLHIILDQYSTCQIMQRLRSLMNQSEYFNGGNF